MILQPNPRAGFGIVERTPQTFIKMLPKLNKQIYLRLAAAGLMLFATLGVTHTPAQTVDEIATKPAALPVDADLRVETIPVQGGAEIVTIFARQSNFHDPSQSSSTEIPLVSILRDTLGDEKPENDRLRYVWMLTYTRATFWQKAAAFVPFLYTRTTNKNKIGNSPPPPIADMQRTDKAMWNRILWFAFKKIVFAQFGVGAKAPALQYRQNAVDYRRSAVASALTILSLYEKTEGEKILTDTELKDIQAKLWLTDKTFGAMMQDENLGRVYDSKIAETRDNRGHNWELLRQYAEAQGLYFDPIEMPDGTAQHAIVSVAQEDLAENANRKFDPRFLNIRDPWSDQKLRNWKGYKQEQWFDEENRVVPADTPNARKRTLIPLALYALDTPKIPGILIDFRDERNPRRREMSRRVLNDLTGNVLSISKFSSIPYFLGRYLYDFSTGRRGDDINQPSRLRSYAQLKMLLALDADMDTALRDELAERVELVSLNPLQNDVEAEAKIARAQYRNLIDYARRPDGLPAQLDRERREEMVKFSHSPKKQVLFTTAHIFTLGLYTHREKATPEMVAKMETRRQLEYHERMLNEIAARSAKPEVDSDIEALKRSLLFMSQNGTTAREKTTRSLAQIFAITEDEDARRLCLTALYKIDNKASKNELLAIYRDEKLDEHWRNLCAQFLKQAMVEGMRFSSSTAAAVAGIATAN